LLSPSPTKKDAAFKDDQHAHLLLELRADNNLSPFSSSPSSPTSSCVDGGRKRRRRRRRKNGMVNAVSESKRREKRRGYAGRLEGRVLFEK